MNETTTSIIPIALSQSDSAIHEWLSQFPKGKRTYHFSQRVEDVLNGIEGKELVIKRKPVDEKPIKLLNYYQREEFELTNRYINFITNNPQYGKISVVLKQAVMGIVFGEMKEWMKESTHFIKTEQKPKKNAPSLTGSSVTSLLTTKQEEKPEQRDIVAPKLENQTVPSIPVIQPPSSVESAPKIVGIEALSQAPIIATPQTEILQQSADQERNATSLQQEESAGHVQHELVSAKNQVSSAVESTGGNNVTPTSSDNAPKVQLNPMMARLMNNRNNG